MARGHILRRGRRWTIVVDVPRGEDGSRKQRWHSGYLTRAAAERALTEIRSRLDTGNYIPVSKTPLASFLREWLEAVRVKVRPSTWASYRLNVERYVIPRLGSVPLQILTPAGLNAFYADLLTGGRTTREGGLAPRSVQYCAMILKRALGEAVRWSLIPRNPADLADPPRPAAASEMRTWSAGELRAFLEYVREDRYYAAWRLAATTGLRRGEVLGLRWRDVDLEAGRLAITQTLLAVADKLSFSAPKTTKSRRSVALDPTTLAVLRDHRVAHVEERLRWGPVYQDADLVFCAEDGSPLHPDRFSKAFAKHAAAAGLPAIRFHDLRHTHATLALQAGVHPKVVSERLGHATVSITLDTYSHAIPAMEEEAAAKVAAVVDG